MANSRATPPATGETRAPSTRPCCCARDLACAAGHRRQNGRWRATEARSRSLAMRARPRTQRSEQARPHRCRCRCRCPRSRSIPSTTAVRMAAAARARPAPSAWATRTTRVRARGPARPGAISTRSRSDRATPDQPAMAAASQTLPALRTATAKVRVRDPTNKLSAEIANRKNRKSGSAFGKPLSQALSARTEHNLLAPCFRRER